MNLESPGNFCFVHLILCFWFLVTFSDKVTKIWKYYVIFVYIAKQKKKTRKKIRQLKWQKYQKPKDENMGWMKHLSKEVFGKSHDAWLFDNLTVIRVSRFAILTNYDLDFKSRFHKITRSSFIDSWLPNGWTTHQWIDLRQK